MSCDIAVWHSKLSPGYLTIRLLEMNMRYNNLIYQPFG